MNLPKRIDSFTGAWSFLSNFYLVLVRLYIDSTGAIFVEDGPGRTAEDYPSVEHAYQAAKFLDPAIRSEFQNISMKPGRAKIRAKELKWAGKVRPDWTQVNLPIMKGLLIQKFSGSILKRKLFSTYGAELIEGNWWHDNFFGNCTCDDCQDIPGLNHLGLLLMEVRTLLSKRLSPSPSSPS